jgi:hypothetical protein
MDAKYKEYALRKIDSIIRFGVVEAGKLKVME